RGGGGGPVLDGVVERRRQEPEAAILSGGPHGTQQGAGASKDAGGVRGAVEGHVGRRGLVALVTSADEDQGVADAAANGMGQTHGGSGDPGGRGYSPTHSGLRGGKRMRPLASCTCPPRNRPDSHAR